MVRRVVTLPPGLPRDAQAAFARAAHRGGAALIELRSDLHDEGSVALEALGPLGVLAAERGRPLPAAWVTRAVLVDRELPASSAPPRTLLSHHAPAPCSPDQAEAIWSVVPRGVSIKHVEPLGPLPTAARLLETQARLAARFGPDRVTVLCTGEAALPFRAVLAERNALDYVAARSTFRAAPGQRLLADATRAARVPSTTDRRGILGSGIDGSASPRLHAPPFDRIDLPADVDVAALLAALRPHYRGLAVTSPFKKRVAAIVGGEAVNTLVRGADGWAGHNTDVDGAAATLGRLPPGELIVLGDGGVTAAVRAAGARAGRAVRVLRRAEARGVVEGPALWTWPAHVDPPPDLRLRGAVAVVAYGAPGRRIEDEIRRRGGEPVGLGLRWLFAQARAQRALWA